MNQIRVLLRVAVLNDPEENGLLEVLLCLPAKEGFLDFVGEAVFDEEVDAVGGELAGAVLEEGETDFLPVCWMGSLDCLEGASLGVGWKFVDQMVEAVDIGKDLYDAWLEGFDVDLEEASDVVTNPSTFELLV